MTRDETFALWRACQDARAAAIALGKTREEAHGTAKKTWNAWADRLLKRKADLENGGLWQVKFAWDDNWRTDRCRASTCEAQAWLKDAYCEFSGYTFTDEVNFSGFIFPGEMNFGSSNDGQSVVFEKRVSFNSTIFHATAQFQNANFLDIVSFSGSNFNGPARFANAQFNKNVNFSNSIFHRKVRFGGSKYLDFSRFCDSVFLDDAQFQNCSFLLADFSKTKFNKAVHFYESQFNGIATFFGSSFVGGEADFSGIISSRTFDLAKTYFEKVPDFIQANFKEAPNLDEIELSASVEPGNFWQSIVNSSNARVMAKYRALRRLAISGHDHNNEQKFFKGEFRARRNNLDKFWHASFWLGIIYDAISDFGRSIVRPLYIWIISLAFFAIAYFANASVPVGDWLKPCVADGNSRVLKALTLSASNALPLIGSARNDVAKAFYSCISLPTVPEWSPIIQIVQTLCSAVLIFLLLLAVRNQFKIK